MKHIFSVIAVCILSIIACASTPDMPKPGDTAPEFTLKNQEGKEINLKDFKGKWVVLYFYPKDFTSGCTIEAKNFQRDITSYEKANAVIVGVSTQDSESHQKFCTKEGLSFMLLADTDKKASKAYDSVMAVVGVSSRHTFLIDPNGKIAKVYTKVNVQKHSEEILAELAELQKK